MMSDYDRAYLEQLLSDIARQRAMIDALWPRFMKWLVTIVCKFRCDCPVSMTRLFDKAPPFCYNETDF